MERSLREAIILDYARLRPGAGFDGRAEGATDAAVPVGTVRRRNPVCGDEVELRLDLSADDSRVVARLRWEGRGCTVSQASAAMLASRAEGLTTGALRRLSDEVHAIIIDPAADLGGLHEAHDLAALAGIGRLPLRARCAALAWDALDELLDASPGLDAATVPDAALLTGPDHAPS